MTSEYFAFDWIARIEATKTSDDMLVRLSEAAGQFGFTACAIATLPDDHRDLNFQKYQYVRRWPPGWFEHYVSRGYLAHDPVIRRVRNSTKPFLWSEAEAHPQSAAIAKTLMHEAAEFGLGAGFCIPSMKLSGEQVSITFGGRTAEMSDKDRMALWMIGIWSHMHIRDLLGPRPVRPKLSPRESEVLKWALHGYRTALIAEKMGISTKTVEFHSGNACTKLDVTTRLQAAVLASRLRII